ncbi:unnamed protein product [Musa acuminata subsp. burmannicoides]
MLQAQSVSMEMAVNISSLGASSLSRCRSPVARSWSKRRALSHRPCRRCMALAVASTTKTRPRRKAKRRRETARSVQELGSRAATKGSFRAKGQRREARIWKLLWPPARSLSLPTMSRWTPIDGRRPPTILLRWACGVTTPLLLICF